MIFSNIFQLCIYCMTIPIIFIVGSVTLNIDTNVDWSPYIEYETYINTNKSNKIINELPIYQYWDSDRADYEVGLLSNQLKDIDIYKELYLLLINNHLLMVK